MARDAGDEVFEFLVLVVLVGILAVALWIYFKAKGLDLSGLWQWLQNLMASGGQGGSLGVTGNDPNAPATVVTGTTATMAQQLQADEALLDSGWDETNVENAQ